MIVEVEGNGIRVELEQPDQPLSLRGARILMTRLMDAINDIERTTHLCQTERHKECKNFYCPCKCHD